MLEGNCHCQKVSWTFKGPVDSATACNCSVCSRYGVLWIYGYEGIEIDVTGVTSNYSRGKALEFHFCSTCACVVSWRSKEVDSEGQRRIAVNLRLIKNPETIQHLGIDHFDGLNTFEDLPRDHRCVKDMWY